MKFKIRYADKIVGILSLIAIIILIIIIFLIGNKQKWFEQKHPFYTVVNSADAVTEGMEIKYKGFGIGKVTSIALDDNDRVVVKFYVMNEHIHRVTKGSVINLSVSPIGLGSSLIFYQGTSGDIIADHSLIPEKSSYEGRRRIIGGEVIIAESTDSISTIMVLVTDILKNVKTLTSQISDLLSGSSRTPLSEIIKNLNLSIDKINKILIGDTSIPTAKVIEELNNILLNLDEVTKNPQGLIPKLLETENSIGSLDTMLNSLSKSIEDINGISSSVKNEMPQVTILLATIQGVLNQTQDVLEGLKNNPLIKRGVSEKIENETATPKLREENF